MLEHLSEHLNGALNSGSQPEKPIGDSIHNVEPSTSVPDESGRAVIPQSKPTAKPRRMVDLSVVTTTLPAIHAVKSLEVRKLKGVGVTFTPNIELALNFQGIVYKPTGEFDEIHQIIAGSLLENSQVAPKSREVMFIPAYAWSHHEVVLHPIKLSQYGQSVLNKFKKLKSKFPNFKVYVEWNGHRHEVYESDLTEQERKLIADITWPTKVEIQNALSPYAYDNIEDLATDNEQIRNMLSSREVK